MAENAQWPTDNEIVRDVVNQLSDGKRRADNKPAGLRGDNPWPHHAELMTSARRCLNRRAVFRAHIGAVRGDYDRYKHSDENMAAFEKLAAQSIASCIQRQTSWHCLLQPTFSITLVTGDE